MTRSRPRCSAGFHRRAGRALSSPRGDRFARQGLLRSYSRMVGSATKPLNERALRVHQPAADKSQRVVGTDPRPANRAADAGQSSPAPLGGR